MSKNKVNFIIKLLLVAGKDMILVVCDKLSKNDNRENVSRRIGKTVQR